MSISKPMGDSSQHENVKYFYDEEGLVEAVEVEGTQFELNDAQKQRFPGRSLPETRSTQTTIKSTVEDIKESYGDMLIQDAQGDDESVRVEIEATHGGYFNDNMYYYRFSGMEDMVGTWTANGGRPYLVFHDKKSTPRGRVKNARAVQTISDNNVRGEPMGFHDLDVRVGDEEEIAMIVDGRALHVSVGSRPVDTVECRICGHDIYHDGRTATRYKLDQEPSNDVLSEPAPGVFGRMGMDKEDFFKVEENDDGEFTAKCRHIRHHDAPMGGDETLETGWIMHSNKYKEVSRVNEPADVNEETGEFAHITGLKEQQDDLSDDVLDKLITDKLSQVPGPTDHARYSIASEDDLWHPRTASEAKKVADDTGYDAMFDTALWNALNIGTQMSMSDKIEKYWEEGGRFVDASSQYMEDMQESDDSSPQEDVDTRFADALEMKPADFGDWLRDQIQKDELDRDEADTLDRIYTNRRW